MCALTGGTLQKLEHQSSATDWRLVDCQQLLISCWSPWDGLSQIQCSPQISESKGPSHREQQLQYKSKSSSFYTNPVRSLHPQIRSLPGRRISGRPAKGFTRFFYGETRCELRFQYISPLVYGSKAALSTVKCDLDILHWETVHITFGSSEIYIERTFYIENRHSRHRRRKRQCNLWKYLKVVLFSDQVCHWRGGEGSGFASETGREGKCEFLDLEWNVMKGIPIMGSWGWIVAIKCLSTEMSWGTRNAGDLSWGKRTWPGRSWRTWKTWPADLPAWWRRTSWPGWRWRTWRTGHPVWGWGLWGGGWNRFCLPNFSFS